MLSYEIGENKTGGLNAEESYAVFIYQGFKTKLSIEAFVRKVNIRVLQDPMQTFFLNEYIYKKGIAGDINRIYSSCASFLSVDSFDPTKDVSSTNVKKVVTAMCHEVLDLFDTEELTQFLVDSDVMAPKDLKDEFDTSVEIDLIVTRDQTYLRREYIGLLAMALIIKAVAPLIGEVYATNKHVILSDNETISFLQFIAGHNFLETKQAHRLIRYIDKHIELKTRSANGIALNIVAIRVQMTADTLWEYILANAFFKKFVTTPIDRTPPLSGNVAAAVYSIIKNTTKDTVAIKSRVSIKENTRPGDGDDSSSVAEGYTQTTEISLGELAEFNFMTSVPENIFREIGGTDIKLLRNFEDAAQALYSKVSVLCKGSVLLTGYIVHNKSIDMRAISHIDYINVVNLMVAAAAFAYENGHHTIANMILLKQTTSADLSTPISPKTAPEPLRKAISAEYVKSVIKPKKSRMREDTDHPVNDLIIPIINKFDKHFITGSYEYLLDQGFRPLKLRSEDNLFVVPSDFKTELILLLQFLLERI